IYSSAESGSSGGGFVNIRNSSFVGNLAQNRGGAIMAEGSGAVEVSNCTFEGNEAVGLGNYRRAGSGGSIYASPGVEVTVLNSSFESCLGLYGGAALFICGGEVIDSTFSDNEATGLFGAVVNGDLSDEDRLDASLHLDAAAAAGGNFTCPPLYVSGTVFDGNVAVGGYGGGLASVDASLSVINATFFSTVGGALYFGTSDGSGRDELEVGGWVGGWVGG
ncbi:unnamed protein product, partial [Laminaria digitata]